MKKIQPCPPGWVLGAGCRAEKQMGKPPMPHGKYFEKNMKKYSTQRSPATLYQFAATLPHADMAIFTSNAFFKPKDGDTDARRDHDR